MSFRKIKDLANSHSAILISIALIFGWQMMHFVSQIRRSDAGFLPIPHDQTLYLQMFENMLRFRGTGGSILGMDSMLSNHFSPVFFLLLPLYGVLKLFFEIPDAILFLSFIMLFAGSVFLFMHAERIAEKKISIVMSLAVMWMGSSSMNFLSAGGFRETFISFIPLAGMLHSFERKNKIAFFIASILLLSIREDYGLILFGFSIVSIFRKDYFWKFYPATGLLVFLFLMLFVMPHFNQEGRFTGYGRFSHLGNSFSEILLSPFLRTDVFFGAIFSPQNLKFIRDMLYPFCFLPLFAPRYMLILLPYLFMLLLNNYSIVPTSSILTWYNAPLLPFLLISSAAALNRVYNAFSDRNISKKIPAFILIFVSLFLFFRQSSFFSVWYFPDPGVSLKQSIHMAKTFITDDEYVTASNGITPFFADRENLEEFDCDSALDVKSYAVLTLDYQRNIGWTKCGSFEDYAEILQSYMQKYNKRIVFSDMNLIVFAPAGTGASLPAPSQLPESWEEAEFTGSDFFYNMTLMNYKGEVARSFPGILAGLLGRRSAGNAVVGGTHSGKGEWVFTVRMTGEIPASCSGDERPEFFVRDMEKTFYREEFPVFIKNNYADLSFFFTMTGDEKFFPVIKYRKCGHVWVDKFRMQKINQR